MKKALWRAAVSVSSLGLLAASFAPGVIGDTTIDITGNGADSENDADVDVSNVVVVNQSNNADITNYVNVSATTGGNEANKNTGGDVSIDTGDASVSTSVSNTANSNVADVPCGGCAGDLNVKISGNGADSENDVDVDVNDSKEANTAINQTNNADVKNIVKVDAKTGKNEANKNTGGDVSIETGDAEVDSVDVSTMVNSNVASIGGGEGGDIEVEISGNGADSDNDVDLDVENGVLLVQDNEADIFNWVEVDASTGWNEAEENTGGSVSIDTGDASVDVSVENMANFNAAEVGCCGMDVEIKISGNGADSENDVDLDADSVLAITQDNDFDCAGHDACAKVEVEAKTGGNEVEENTGDVDDPGVETGDADASVSVSNMANKNVVGDVDLGDIELPDLSDLPGDLHSWVLMLLAFMQG